MQSFRCFFYDLTLYLRIFIFKEFSGNYTCRIVALISEEAISVFRDTKCVGYT